MSPVAATPAAVFAQLDPLRVVALALVGLVVPALALLAGEGDSDPDISAGHLDLPVRRGQNSGDPNAGAANYAAWRQLSV
jgi:hypothetical protein